MGIFTGPDLCLLRHGRLKKILCYGRLKKILELLETFQVLLLFLKVGFCPSPAITEHFSRAPGTRAKDHLKPSVLRLFLLSLPLPFAIHLNLCTQYFAAHRAHKMNAIPFDFKNYSLEGKNNLLAHYLVKISYS